MSPPFLACKMLLQQECCYRTPDVISPSADSNRISLSAMTPWKMSFKSESIVSRWENTCLLSCTVLNKDVKRDWILLLSGPDYVCMLDSLIFCRIVSGLSSPED